MATFALILGSSHSLAEEKSNYNASLERAIEFYSEKKYAEAVALLDTVSRLQPERKEAFLWLGHAHAQLKNWSAAREAYKRYNELAPEDVEGPSEVARTYEMEGKKDLAKLWYKKALDLEPANGNIKEALARVANDQPPAERSAAEAATPKPSDEPQPTQDPASVWKRFWREGLAGILGARTVWWGRVLAIVIFGMMMIHGAFTSSRSLKEHFPNAPSALIAVNTVVATAFLYVLFWGIPSSFGWALMGLCIVATAGIGAGAAATR